jgi:hypothetical protein
MMPRDQHLVSNVAGADAGPVHAGMLKTCPIRTKLWSASLAQCGGSCLTKVTTCLYGLHCTGATARQMANPASRLPARTSGHSSWADCAGGGMSVPSRNFLLLTKYFVRFSGA